jgi:hypothetical protein
MVRSTSLALMLSVTLGSCSPYYTALPKALTYQMETDKRAEPPRPDPVAIATNEMPSIIAASAVQNAAVGPPRMGKYGWGFCLTATVVAEAGPTKIALWVTVYDRGVYGRRQVEPGDQCEFDRYTAIVGRQ